LEPRNESAIVDVHTYPPAAHNCPNDPTIKIGFFWKRPHWHAASRRTWDSAANSILEHIAGIDDFEVAEATYQAAVARWPKAIIILRQGARIVHDSRRSRIAK
jgi:hypothetical protein